jgi:hypothetical protein
MGLDFVRKAAPNFHRGLDRRRIELGTPGLFSRKVESIPRSYAAAVHDGQALGLGEKLGLCLKGDEVLVLRGLCAVGIVRNAPAELVTALGESFGEACGIVRVVHEISSFVEITVC